MTDNTSSQDMLLRLIFEGVTARAHFVTLSGQWAEVASRHIEAPEVIALLGEMTTASILLSASLKYDGAVVLQIHGDGPVRLAVAECNSALDFRSTVKMSETLTVAPGSDWKALVNQHGLGRFSVVLDPNIEHQRPYQGIVPLHESGVAKALEAYMAQSEQLPSRLWLACDGETTAGLLLQKMPSEGGTAVSGATDDDWARLVALAETVTRTELLGTEAETLLHQLFWQEKPRLLDERPVRFHCACTREKVGRMLRSLGSEEVSDILREQKRIEVHCDFCNTAYRFNSADCEKLFSERKTLADRASKTLH